MSYQEFSEVYAVPGQNSIIDAINPDTGLTVACGRSEAEVVALNPGAVRMPFEEWRTASAARQDTPIAWEPSTEEKYHEMLNMLPPALWIFGAFLVGEPEDHSFATGAPRYAAYWERGGAYLTASRPLTCAELRAEIKAARS